MTPATIPRPEHPRPEATRPAWTTLNGTWEFELDPGRVGLARSWQSRDRLDREILVPFPFQSRLSGIDDQSFIDTCWYARTFRVPQEHAGKQVLLQFGAVDHECHVFVNGILAGHHVGGVTPFTIDATALLRDGGGDQRVALRVFDPPFDPGIPRGKQTTAERLHGCSYEKVSGIWQTAWLEFTGPIHVDREHLTIRTDPRAGTVKVSARIAGDRRQHHVIEARVLDGNRQLSETGFNTLGIPGLGGARANVFDVLLHVDPAAIVTWSPATPKLYTVEVSVIDGESDDEARLDTLSCTFGFRTFETRGQKLYLNGEDIYLKMPLYQGYWPDGLWTPPSDDAIRKDIELALEMGFNAMRLHQKLEDPRLLHWADRLGLLLWGEFANNFSGEDHAHEMFLAEWAAGVRRDRNHPAIVAWVPFNESWGTGDLSTPAKQSHMRAAYHLTKMLDPTRPVIDNDGWEHVLTDICTIHDYIMPDGFGKKYPVQPPDVVSFLEGLTSPRAYAPGIAPATAPPVVMSEWGGWSMNLDDRNATPDPHKCWGYQGVLYRSFDEILDLYERFTRLLVQRKGWIAGHCYTEFCDQYQEMNGFLTFDRRPKGDLARIKAINDLL